MIPLSLYIHLPWCIKKCPYCDFNAHPLNHETDFKRYIHRLIEDLHSHQQLLQTRSIYSIFIGGGTPSIMSPDDLYPLFQAIKSYQDISNIEVTIEANPGTQDCGYYQGYRELGINRISIGGQSFQEKLLTNIGRIHNSKMTHLALEQAKSAGFKRINLDIMYGLPEQTLNECLMDLKSFLSHKIEHLSWYQLNIEANTLFAVQKPNLPKEELIETMDAQGEKLLNENGYEQYEISAWTNQQGSLHNLNYWRFGDYLGIGCGAHSKITYLEPFRVERIIKHKHPKAYYKALIQSQVQISENDLLLEFAINHFRIKAPICLQSFEMLTNTPAQKLISKLSTSITQGYMTHQGSTLTLTPKGFKFHNDLLLAISSDK